MAESAQKLEEADLKTWFSEILTSKFAAQEAMIKKMLSETSRFDSWRMTRDSTISGNVVQSSMPLSEISGDLFPKIDFEEKLGGETSNMFYFHPLFGED